VVAVWVPRRGRPSRPVAQSTATGARSTCETGFPSPPVRSSAPPGPWWACRQGRKAPSAREVGPEACRSGGRWPSALPRRRPAVRGAAWTSIPQPTGELPGLVRPACTHGYAPPGRQSSRLQVRCAHACSAGSTWGGTARGTDRFLYGCSARKLTGPLADVPRTAVYRMSRPRGMDFIRRGEDNVFMNVSYSLPIRLFFLFAL
jgi:hypothetical protein